jgi:hypothetical protein
VYDAIGVDLIKNALEGYGCALGAIPLHFGRFNTALLAYGQTGSGKSFSMMGASGSPEHRGIIPRLCEDLFARIATNQAQGWSAKVEVSYLEM